MTILLMFVFVASLSTITTGCGCGQKGRINKAEAQETVKQSDDLASSTCEIYYKTLSEGNKEKAINATVDWLKKQPGVQGVQVTPMAIVYHQNGLAISIETEDNPQGK